MQIRGDYLIKFIDRVLEGVDKSEACAVLATLVDWKQAFPRQCPTLGVKSFVKNGVRPALIPLLFSLGPNFSLQS